MNKVQYNVSGLLNSQIKIQLRNVLNELDGVQKIDIDTGRGLIGVGYNNSIDENEIRQGIEHVGCKIE